MVFYLDIIFGINVLFNYLVLVLTNYLTKAGKRQRRVFLGAVYAALIVPLEFIIPAQLADSFLFKTLYACMIIFVAFGYNGIYRFVKQFSTFLFVMFTVGGGLFGIQLMIRDTDFSHNKLLVTVQNIDGEPVSLLLLFLFFPLLILFMKGKLDKHVKDKIKYDEIYQVTLVLGDTQKSTNGYIDSGNQLTDPFTGKPVVICDQLFLQQFFERNEWEGIVHCIETTQFNQFPEVLQQRLSIVPYQGVGGKNGMLFTFKPDKLIVYYEDTVLETDKVLIGIQLTDLAVDNSFHCLLHPTLIRLKMKQAA